MPTAANDHTTPEVHPPSRRSLFSGAAALLAALPLGTAAALTPTSNSDQTMASVTPIGALQRRMTSLVEERYWMDQQLVEMNKGPEYDALYQAFDQNLDELLDIEEQIASLPARNLHDAAIQAAVAFSWVMHMEVCEPLELDPNMRPLLASITLAVSRAGAIDTDKLMWGDLGDFLKRCHAEVVA